MSRSDSSQYGGRGVQTAHQQRIVGVALIEGGVIQSFKEMDCLAEAELEAADRNDQVPYDNGKEVGRYWEARIKYTEEVNTEVRS